MATVVDIPVQQPLMAEPDLVAYADDVAELDICILAPLADAPDLIAYAIVFPAPSGASIFVTGEAVITLAGDTATGVGGIEVLATAAITLDDDTSTSTVAGGGGGGGGDTSEATPWKPFGRPMRVVFDTPMRAL